MYYDKPYFIVPADDLAEEAYVVLRDALKAAKKIGVGQLAMRGQEYVVAIKPCGRGMLLETLRYADEVNKAQSYFREIGNHEPDADLLDMAAMLIERKTGKFDPSEFHNRYVDALHKLIAEKQRKKGREGHPRPGRRRSAAQGLECGRSDGRAETQPWRRQGWRQRQSRRCKEVDGHETGAAPCAKESAGQENRGPQESLSHGAQGPARHCDLQQEARLLEDQGAAGAQAKGKGRPLRRAET
jgi:hypothetical protein